MNNNNDVERIEPPVQNKLRKEKKVREKIDDETRNFFKCKGYTIGSEIGFGTYGTIYEGQMNRDDIKGVRKIAAKVIDKRKRVFNLDMYQNELRALSRCKHENIICIHGLMESKDLIAIFMDLAEDGDLLTYIQKNGALNEAQSQAFFRQIAWGLQYMHGACYLAHLDVKCENILLHKGHMKLTDFGFSTEFLPIHIPANIHRKRVGTFEYNPPQLMVENPAYYPPKVDVYSSGITLFIMVYGRFPFFTSESITSLKWKEVKNQQENYLVHLERKLATKFSNDFKGLLYKMLNPNESMRLTMANVLEDRWLNNPEYRQSTIAMQRKRPETDPVDFKMIKPEFFSHWSQKKTSVVKRTDHELTEDERQRSIQKAECSSSRKRRKVEVKMPEALKGKQLRKPANLNKPIEKSTPEVRHARSHLPEECNDESKDWNQVLEDGIVKVLEQRDSRRCREDWNKPSHP